MSVIRTLPVSIDATARPRPLSRWLAPLGVMVVGVAVLAPSGVADAAQTPVGLGTAASFAVLAGSTVTNTGPSVIRGNLGLSPGSAVTGFPPGIVNNGVQHVTDAAAGQAQLDLTTAYNTAAHESPVSATSAATLGAGQSLSPGIYNSASSSLLTGALTLNGGGNPSALFVFQVGTQLTTATSSTVNLINGAQACNVFWQVGSSATLGTTTNFVGTIMANQSISLDNAVTVNGRALASVGAVTLINDTFTVPTCTTPSGTTVTTLGGANAAAKTPSPNGTGTSTGTGTPGGTGTGTPGGTGTPTGTTTTGTLPFTGMSPVLPVLGATLVGSGLILMGLSNARRRRTHA